MSNKQVLITGSTSGIGLITAMELAKQGHDIVLHARDRERAEQTKKKIQNETGNKNIDYLLADFSSLEEVSLLADTYNKHYGSLDLLINNAGLILGKERRLSSEGYELTLTINHLSPFLLTSLLFETLQKSARKNGESGVRIINVASEAHRGAFPDFDDISMEKSYSGWKAYCNSKLYNIMFTRELARRIDDLRPSSPAHFPKDDSTLKTGNSSSNSDLSSTPDIPASNNIFTYSLHPGTVATNFSNSAGGWVQKAFQWMRPLLSTPEQGASTTLFLSTEEKIKSPSGSYFINRKPAKVRNKFFTPEHNQRLWEMSEKMTGESFL